MSQLQTAVQPQPDYSPAMGPPFPGHSFPTARAAWPILQPVPDDIEPHMVPLPDDAKPGWEELDELTTNMEELQGGWSLPVNLDRQMDQHLLHSEESWRSEQQREQLKARYNKQIQMELEARRCAYDEIKEEFARDRNLFGAANTKSGKTLIDRWLPAVTQAIEKELGALMKPPEPSKPASSKAKGAKAAAAAAAAAASSKQAAAAARKDQANYLPFITYLNDPKEMATISLSILLNMTLIPDRKDENKAGKCKAAAACLAIGKALNDRAAVMKLQQEVAKRRKEQAAQRRRLRERQLQAGVPEEEALALDSSSEDVAYGVMTDLEASKMERKLEVLAVLKSRKLRGAAYLRKAIHTVENKEFWDKSYQLKLGARMVQLICSSAVVQDPATRRLDKAFQHSLEWLGKKQVGFIQLTSTAMDVIDKNLQGRSVLSGIDVAPMLIPPKKWHSLFSGGYLTARVCVVRARHSKRALEVLRSFDQQGRLGDVYAGLNALGGLAWQVNRENLAVLEELWQRGEYIGKMPPKDPPPLPVLPEQLPFRAVVQPKGSIILTGGPPVQCELDAHRFAVSSARKAIREHKGLLVTFQHRMEIARKCVDEQELYYPHTLDFRGRAYPMHPHLQHLGDDVCRGLLRFAQGQPLGEQGLDWLYIQVANLWGQGKDKLPFQLRVRFAREQLHHILDSAMEPVHGQRWWAQGEKPFQLLATCMDIKNALASGNPTTYVSTLPVHMDGSCNGLQHYAALGRDEEGGRAVNLLPCDQPQDVYSRVSEIVASRVAADARAGRTEAGRLDGLVDRKMVKQTVMTSVYGVTFIGARDQIRNRLKDRGWSNPQEIMKTSNYLAEQTLRSIGQLFSGAKATMDWLQNTAKAVTATGQVVQWVTPLGLPVLQPYTRTNTYKVPTCMQSFTMLHEDTHATSRVARGRQKQAFPPNYIHSLDSTHMLMTATRCHHEGLSFAGVHDSYWTHAGSVKAMNRILRDTFVTLHSQPLLEDLKAYLEGQHPEADIPPLPKRGGLNLNQVKNAKYFFS